jgi:hypothetical protein
MVDFSAIADIIGAVITDQGLGASVTLTTVTPGTYNPATGTATPATTTATVDAIIEDFKGWELANGLVQVGDKKVSIAASVLSAAPTPGDTVQIGAGLAYTVVSVSTTEAGGVPILYVLTCRRA